MKGIYKFQLNKIAAPQPWQTIAQRFCSIGSYQIDWEVYKVEDEYYVRIEHEMTKQHYISFVAALSENGFQMVKLYPEQNAEARFKIHGARKLLFYCNRDGLYSYDMIKGIEDRRSFVDKGTSRC